MWVKDDKEATPCWILNSNLGAKDAHMMPAPSLPLTLWIWEKKKKTQITYVVLSPVLPFS